LPNTALWTRLQQEQRLIEGVGVTEAGDQNTLMNFLPTRPIAEIAREYVEGFWKMYEPTNYLRRCFQQCLNLGSQSGRKQTMRLSLRNKLRLVVQLIWHQGLRRSAIRGQFWRQLWIILLKKPQVLNLYLGLCAAGEHFWEYRVLARERITQQLGYDILEVPALSEQKPMLAGVDRFSRV
jgi:Domain of unknown function (DUF4070)